MKQFISLLLALLVTPAFGASVVDAWGGTGSGTSVNVAITVPAGDDQLLCVAVENDAATVAVPTVTFNGDAVVEVADSTGTGQYLWVGCLVAPDQTSANVSVSGVSIDRSVAVVLLEDVDQSSPTGMPAVAENGATSSLDSGSGVSTSLGGVVLSFVAVNNISGSQITSTGSGQTDIAETELGTGSYAMKAAQQDGTGSSVVSGFSWVGTPRASMISFHVADSGGGGDPDPEITATKVVFGSQPGNVVVGQTFGAFTVRAVDDEDALDDDFTGDVTIALQTGDGSLGGTLTQAAVAGIATFDDVYINTLNTDAVIRATSDGLTAADSDVFDVTAGGEGGAAGFPSTSRLGGMLQ